MSTSTLLARLAAIIQGALTPGRTWRDHARRRGLVPVLSDWVFLYAVDADGRPVRTQDTTWRTFEEETDALMRHVILTQAAIRHPHLDGLRPVRMPGDRECPSCGGSGARSGSRKICLCGGAGWIPAGVPPHPGIG